MKNLFSKIKLGLQNFGKKIANAYLARFGGLHTLVMLQLKDKLNMSFKADKKGALTKLLIRIILFVLITVVIVIVISLMDRLVIFGMSVKSLPYPIFNLLFSAMIILSTITCITSLTKSLYFSRDNLTLLSYPVNSNTVFMSKLVVYYILSLLREAGFILPLFIAYGITAAFSVGYFFWLIPVYLVVCAVPVAIAAIVSIPWMFASMFFRKRPLAQDIGTLLVLIAGSVGLFFVIDAIPSNMHFLTQWSAKYYPALYSFALKFEHYLPPTYWITSFTTGATYSTNSAFKITLFTPHTFMYFGIVLGAVIIFIVAAYLFAKPLFFKMAAKPFEFNKKVILHNLNVSKTKAKSTYHGIAFIPSDYKGKKLTAAERIELNKKIEYALNAIHLHAHVFERGINENRILKNLEGYTKIKFETVNVDEFVDSNVPGVMIRLTYGVPTLVLAKLSGAKTIHCYDPDYLVTQNHPKSSFFSMMWKDTLMAIRTPGTLVSDYVLIMTGPFAILLLNKLFQSINTSFMGDKLVVIFNILMFTMIPLVTNVAFASIYSREGESSYLLKASPSNYMKTLSAKLVLRWVLMTVSLVLTTIVFSKYCDVFFNKPWYIFGAVLCLYTGHLIWSAELDFMNPQDQLYKEVGEGNISNPNENLSGILAFLITFLFVGVGFFLMDESIRNVYPKLLAIGAFFLVCRLILGLLKVKGYKTSRGERGRN